MEGFFAACGLPDILERSPRGERPHGSETSPLPDGGPGQTLPKVRHGIRLPCRSIPETEHHGPHVRQDGLPLPPARNSHETGRLPGSSRASSRVVRVPAPSTRPSLPISPKRPSPALRRAMPPALSKRMPDGIRLFIAGRPLPVFPELFQRPGSKHEREREKENTPPPFTPQHPPSSSPAVCHALFQTAARQRRGLSPRPEESFFGDGESTRGEGAVFTKNAPSPLVIPPLHSPSTTKKAGQSPAPAFTGKTKEQ